MRKLRIGDKVKVIDGCFGDLSRYLGRTGIIESIGGNRYNPYRIKGFEDVEHRSAVWSAEELELAEDKPITYRDALLHTLNGTMTVRHTSMKQGEYLVFNDSWYDNNGKPRTPDYLNDNIGNWEQYIVPTPPKFTIDELVYNTDGTIGKVVEDKGIHKGERCYSVRYNAVRDVTKHVKESELTEYSL